MSTRGIHLAVHTNEALLSTGAWMDFSQHINMLVLRGDVEEAGALWGLVFEVVHMGVDPATPVLQSMDMPPIRRMPCCKTPCVRCETGRGGLQFPFIGPALQPPQQGLVAIHPPCPQQVRFGSLVRGVQSGLAVHGDDEACLWPSQYWLQAVGAPVLAMASGCSHWGTIFSRN